MKEPPSLCAWILWACAVAMLALWVVAVHAHDADNPALNGWYESLRSQQGSPCCDGSDFKNGTAAHVETENWETQDKPNSHFRVNLDGAWQDVPDSAVVNVPNKDGRALVWFMSRGPIMPRVIRCFMPGTMS